jgi:HTH-type transcriptional regulator / antitoxin HigA
MVLPKSKLFDPWIIRSQNENIVLIHSMSRKRLLPFSQKYSDVFTTDENERALAIVQDLMAIAHRSPEEDSLLELLVQLIERFEEEHYSFELNASESKLANPRSILLHLMEEHDLKQADLVGVIGSRGVVSEVVNGKREISKAQAAALARLFHVDVGLFIA